MKMRYLMVIFLLFCYACVTSGKGNVKFNSTNFYNVLVWDPAALSVPGETVRYSVLYGVTDDGVFNKTAGCQNITALSCDLTSVTLPHYDTHYRAQVLANGALHGITRSFKPIRDTVLGAPSLSFNTTRVRNESSLHINVTLPLGPYNESFKDIFIRNHKGPHEAIADYTLTITKPPSAQLKNSLGHFEVFLKNQAECCGYVVYTPVHESGRELSEKASFCVKLPQEKHDPLPVTKILPWLLLSVAVVAALVLTAALCVNHYIKNLKKDKLPSSLISNLPPSQLVLHPEKESNISKAEMFVEREVTQYAKIQMRPSAVPVSEGGYGHKNTIFMEDSSLDTEGLPSPGLQYQDNSGQSSEIYGAVTVEDCHHPDRNMTALMSSGDGSDESRQLLSTPKTIPLSTVDIFDTEAQPLFVQTRQNSEGQLILPMLSFQGQHSFTETKAELVTPERKPLLSYLIVSSDKGSNFVSLHSLESCESDSGLEESTLPTPTQEHSQYLPSQPRLNQDCGQTSYLSTQQNWTPQSPLSPVSCDSQDSAYKQNWMPSFNPQTLNSSYPWTWSGVKEENTQED